MYMVALILEECFISPYCLIGVKSKKNIYIFVRYKNNYLIKKINMKKAFTFLLGLVICVNLALSQDRYLDEVFTTVDTTANVVYGVNYGVLSGTPIPTGMTVPIDTLGNTYTEPPLAMDIYEPNGDTMTERPLVIHLHTGTFLPIIHNGNPTGTRSDFATTKFCEAYAKRGYVVANIDYRLGWNPLLTTQEERAASLMTAVYRAIQDCKAAVRYFRMTYENGNPYGIDTSRIVLSGQGSGGWVALGYATLDKVSEIQLSKFLLIDSATQIAYPAIDTSINGDWDGFGGWTPTNTPTGYPSLNMENHKGYSSDIDMVLNMGGGIGDLSWLEAGDVPMCGVHCPSDAIATYTTGDVSVALIGLVTTDISGSHDVMNKANDLGNNDVLNNAFYNDVYTTAAQSASQAIIGTMDNGGTTISESVDNVFPFVTGNTYESAPWEYFDSATTVYIATAVLGLPASAGTSAYNNGLQTNPNMTLTKSMAYIDSTMGYFAPRMVNVLDLPGSTVGISELNNKLQANIFPNPANDHFVLSLKSNESGLLNIYDIAGSLMKSVKVNGGLSKIDIKGIDSGAYIVEAISANGSATFKLMKN
ncbi:MAG TPA: T9SS type A sorting domain-containing protein [Bacteroidetes bacterium]|nr:T9SS type A sorting domain-containing protein [Bacteroidota bacterium]